MPMRKLKRFHEISFGEFLGRAFDHKDVVFRADINQVEVALFAFGVCWISDELTVHPTDPNRPDRSDKWNVGNAKRRRGAVNRENVGIVFAIRTKQDRDDLGIVKISLRKKRPERPIDHARSESFLFRRPSFALEIAPRELPHRSRFFAIIDCERKIILTFLDNCG